LVALMRMQRILACALTVEQYESSEAHLQVVAEGQCPNCEAVNTLGRHGTYGRWVTGELGRLIWILAGL